MEFVIGNGLIERTISFKNNIPVKSVFVNKATGYTWENANDIAIINIPGFDWSKCETEIFENKIIFRSNFEIMWEFIVIDNTPVIETRVSVKGKPLNSDASVSAKSSGVENGAEKKYDLFFPEVEAIENISCKNRHLELEIIEFFDATDDFNTLVKSSFETMYARNTQEYRGNVFVIDDYLNNEECVIIKNSPTEIAHLNKKNGDLVNCLENYIYVSGSGIDYSAINEDEFTPAYSVAVALCEMGASREVFRKYYAHYYNNKKRFIMSNTWGDRNQDKCICEEFILKEIDRAAFMGIDVVQIDDGWETGTTANSALVPDGPWCGGYYSRCADFWKVNEKKFPNGFKKVVDYAKEKGVELGLWFSPDDEDDYAKNMHKDLETLMYYYNTFGIRYFKFDGIRTSNKKREINILKLFDMIKEASGGNIVINSDITADIRLGYLAQKEYVNLFVENRYTDWKNYYTHNTLRNLWQLSEFIPASKMQFEVLNLRRNTENYNDILAPNNYDMDYAFATVMAANPLIWMEMDSLGHEDAEKLKGIVEVYKKYRDDFLKVVPILDKPNGISLTGFSIEGEKDNYVILIREASKKDTAEIKIKEVLYTNDKDLKIGDNSVTFSKERSYVFAKI